AWESGAPAPKRTAPTSRPGVRPLGRLDGREEATDEAVPTASGSIDRSAGSRAPGHRRGGDVSRRSSRQRHGPQGARHRVEGRDRPHGAAAHELQSLPRRQHGRRARRKAPRWHLLRGRVRRIGKARGTHVRGTVVRQLAGRLVMSAGGSVFALRLAGKQGASEGSGLSPGDRVDCHVRFKGGNPETRNGDVDKIGHDGQLVLEGIYLSTDENGTIELAVIHKGRVFVSVPADVEVPDFQAGDEVALVVTVEDDGSFTLVKGESENEPGDGDDD